LKTLLYSEGNAGKYSPVIYFPGGVYTYPNAYWPNKHYKFI
jgi:hypothetical protein